MTPDPSPRLISCVGVDFDLPLLGHFIAHYRALGVAPDRMHILLNAPDPESENLALARATLAEAGVEPIVWIAPYTSDAMWQRRREVQAQVAAPGDWILSADVDELHEYPAPLPEMLAWSARRGISALQGPMIDRLAADGGLASVEADRPLAEQFPIQADVMCALGGVGQHHNWSGTVKLMAFRAELQPSRGGHAPLRGPGGAFLYGRLLSGHPRIGEASFRFFLPTRVHHFKWTSALIPSLERRLVTPGVSPAGAEYGAKLRRLVSRPGRVDLGTVPIRRRSLEDALPWRAKIAWVRVGGVSGLRARIGRRRFRRSPG